MAQLTITIGQLVASVSANNTKASNLLSAYADAIGATGTNQEKAKAVLTSLVDHMHQEAQRHASNVAVTTALADVSATLTESKWEE